MTARVILVRTTGPAKTELTDSTAAAHQDLTGRDVKKVAVSNRLCGRVRVGSLCLVNLVIASH